MKIQIASDLHLEFSDINIKNENGADVLILAGDIGIAEDLHNHPEMNYGMYSSVNLADLGRRQATVLRFRDFFRRVSFQFPQVIYVAGNHEFYHGRWHQGLEYLRDEMARFPNVHFLEDSHVEIEGVIFVGGTLWSDMNRLDPITLHAIADRMNDFRVIRNDAKGYSRLKPADAALRHRQTLRYISDTVRANADKPVVVVGHHAPSFASVAECYRGDYVMNGGYASELSDFILDNPNIRLWCHGHMHNCSDYMIGATRVVCNPRGYETPGYSEDTGWNPNLVVDI